MEITTLACCVDSPIIPRVAPNGKSAPEWLGILTPVVAELRHLGLPVMAVGQMEGEESRVQHNGTVRTIYLEEGHIAGFRLAGDASSAGIYRSLMDRGEDVTDHKERLLAPSFGMGHLEGLASLPWLTA
jgi:NAD(P)H-nitrite reductase large subunit